MVREWLEKDARSNQRDAGEGVRAAADADPGEPPWPDGAGDCEGVAYLPGAGVVVRGGQLARGGDGERTDRGHGDLLRGAAQRHGEQPGVRTANQPRLFLRRARERYGSIW